MALFQYKGRNQRGESVRGHLEAASPDAVAAQLMNTGVIPIEIAIAQARADILGALRARMAAGTKIGLMDLVMFSRQMYTLTKAGAKRFRYGFLGSETHGQKSHRRRGAIEGGKFKYVATVAP